MLDIAIKHKEQLTERFRETWFQDKYKYWNYANYFEEITIEESTWVNHQFVSLDSSGDVIGYIGYKIDRSNDYVYALNIINFTENKSVFGMDAGQALRNIFEKFYFRKLCFSVVVGNQIEKTYDKMIERYRGRISGYQKEQVRLIDGQFYDEKMYEILAKDYFAKMKYKEANK